MLPGHKVIQAELRKFIRVDSVHGFILYVTDFIFYFTAIYGVIYLPDLWMKVIASIFAGIKISNLSVIAHDAAHNSLTKSRRLNKFIAITSLLPCLFNYRLWLYDHNKLHHTQTNEDFPDSYTPYSKEQFDSLPALRQKLERLYRKPSLLYFGLYYIIERWSKAKFLPRKHMPVEIHSEAWKYFGLLMLYLVAFISLLAYAPMYSRTSTVTAVSLGFILPFYIFQSLYAAAVYVQHTHPRIAWFNAPPDRNETGRQELISVNLVCPKWINILVHHIFDHSAHHACPAIPCYQLGAAQRRLNELMNSYAVTEKLSLTALFRTMEICKLYDYTNHRWLDFDGCPTSQVNIFIKDEKQEKAA